MARVMKDIATRSFLAIKGIPMPTPAQMKYTVQDFDSDLSTRSTDGTMVRDRITVKRKLECTWRVLSPQEVSLLLRTLYTSNSDYNAVAQDSVTLPADYNDFYNMSAAQQQELLSQIQNVTGQKIDPTKYYEDDTYRQNMQDRVTDGLAEYNAERNDRIFFPLTFHDPMSNSYETMTVYVGDRNVDWLWAQLENGKGNMNTASHYTMFQNITANFIEK